ncbi:hypothetical protein PILCRDRAFT_88322 [Piloderma croceum F 1598]|uniref:Uncharacterized protein n=1 Tax=Piloderma croceum (strain F 1598) TaxID=765440 RepID=A0A0C3FTK1_PILCF|nr:hypothetical protein PILCRDRAFT_88322 [Piloderma croceum F 1598]
MAQCTGWVWHQLAILLCCLQVLADKTKAYVIDVCNKSSLNWCRDIKKFQDGESRMGCISLLPVPTVKGVLSDAPITLSMIQKKLNSYTQKSACHALSYARAVQATLLAQEDSASKEIDEMEEYLGLLQAKRDIIHIQVSEAEEQVGLVREALDSDGITENTGSTFDKPGKAHNNGVNSTKEPCNSHEEQVI